MIELLGLVAGFFVTVATAVFLGMLSQEGRSRIRRAELAALKRLARKMPEQDAQRWAEEWSAEHSELEDRPIQQLMWSLSLVRRHRQMRAAVRPARHRVAVNRLPGADSFSAHDLFERAPERADDERMVLGDPGDTRSLDENYTLHLHGHYKLDIPEPDQFLVEHLGLPLGTSKLLQAVGIRTLDDLQERSEAELRAIPGITEESLREAIYAQTAYWVDFPLDEDA